jgi:hypothetical protein
MKTTSRIVVSHENWLVVVDDDAAVCAYRISKSTSAAELFVSDISISRN